MLFSRDRRHAWLLGSAAFLVLLTLWALLALALQSPVFLPGPAAVARTLQGMSLTASLWTGVGASVLRIAVGFAASVVVAVPLGILCGSSRTMRAILEPPTAFVRYIPPPAFIPLSILWLGIGETEKYFVIFITIVPYLLLLVADAVAAVPDELREVGRTLGVRNVMLHWKVILPASLPAMWDAMRIMVGSAWTFIILAEITAAESGLGYILIQSQRFLRTAEVLAVMVVIGLLGLLTDAAFQSSYKIFFPWSPKGRR